MTQNRYAPKAWATCTATLLSLCSVAGQAQAPDTNTVDVSVTVRFADLNLGTRQGAEALYARIRSAARQVCGPENEKNLDLFSNQRRCREKAIADAVAHVGNPQLRAIYEARGGQITKVPAVARR